MTAMKVDLEKLLALQEVTAERRKLKERTVACSRRLAEIATLEKGLQAEIQTLEEKLMRLKKEIRDGESELAAVEEKLAKAKARLNLAKSEKECTAAQHEIETLEDKRSQLDEQLLRHMDEQEQVERELAKKKEHATKAFAEWSRERERLEVARQQAEELYKALAGDEERFTTQIGSELADIYRHILEKQHWPAVVAIKDGACGGCGTLLPVNFVHQLKLSHEVEMCPQCRRLLHFPSA